LPGGTLLKLIGCPGVQRRHWCGPLSGSGGHTWAINGARRSVSVNATQERRIDEKAPKHPDCPPLQWWVLCLIRKRRWALRRLSCWAASGTR